MVKHEGSFVGVETTLLDDVVEAEAKERAEARAKAEAEARKAQEAEAERLRLAEAERRRQEEVCYCSATRSGLISRG